MSAVTRTKVKSILQVSLGKSEATDKVRVRNLVVRTTATDWILDYRRCAAGLAEH